MHRKITLLFAGTFFLAGCSDKLMRETITTNDIKIEWYYESYISNTRDFVAITKDKKTEIVIDMPSEQITDIYLIGDTVTVKSNAQ